VLAAGLEQLAIISNAIKREKIDAFFMLLLFIL
jgi:hypothetical protein